MPSVTPADARVMTDGVSIDVREWNHDLRSQVDFMIRSGLDNDQILQGIKALRREGKLPDGPTPSRQQISDLRRAIQNEPLKRMEKLEPHFGLMDQKSLEDHLRKRSLESGSFDESVKLARKLASVHRAYKTDPSASNAASCKVAETATSQWLALESTTGLSVVPGVTNGNEIIVMGVVHSDGDDADERQIIGWFFTSMLMMLSLFLTILKHGADNLQVNVDGTYKVVKIQHVSHSAVKHFHDPRLICFSVCRSMDVHMDIGFD